MSAFGVVTDENRRQQSDAEVSRGGTGSAMHPAGSAIAATADNRQPGLHTSSAPHPVYPGNARGAARRGNRNSQLQAPSGRVRSHESAEPERRGYAWRSSRRRNQPRSFRYPPARWHAFFARSTFIVRCFRLGMRTHGVWPSPASDLAICWISSSSSDTSFGRRNALTGPGSSSSCWIIPRRHSLSVQELSLRSSGSYTPPASSSGQMVPPRTCCPVEAGTVELTALMKKPSASA